MARALPATLALLLAACTCATEETPLATLDTPMRAVLERVDRTKLDALCAGGHGFGLCVPELRNSTEVVVRIPGPPEVILRADGCRSSETDGALAAAPGGKHIAWRCGGTWRYAHLGREGRAFPAGEAPVRDGAVDWSAVPSLADAAAALVERYGDPLQRDLNEDVRATAGDDALVALLIASSHRELGGGHANIHNGGAWAAARADLPEPARAAIDAGLARRATAAGEAPTDALLVRALVHGALVDPAHAPAIAAALDARLTREGGPPEALAGGLLAGLSRHDPAGASERGCRILDMRRPGGAGIGRAMLAPAVIAIGVHRQPCAALTRLVEDEPCGTGLLCPTTRDDPAPPLCDPAERADRLAFATPSYDNLAETSTTPGSVRDLAPAALVHTGQPLPESFQRRHARRLYRIDAEIENDPNHCLARVPTSPSCLCYEAGIRDAACRAPLEEATTRDRMCSIEIDDRGRTLVVRPLAAVTR